MSTQARRLPYPTKIAYTQTTHLRPPHKGNVPLGGGSCLPLMCTSKGPRNMQGQGLPDSRAATNEMYLTHETGLRFPSKKVQPDPSTGSPSPDPPAPTTTATSLPCAPRIVSVGTLPGYLRRHKAHIADQVTAMPDHRRGCDVLSFEALSAAYSTRGILMRLRCRFMLFNDPPLDPSF